MWLALFAGIIAVLIGSAIAYARWGIRWGATPGECSRTMAGDAYFEGGPPNYLPMTRAIDIDAPPETVWPWLIQVGRGAGWYSYDFLDNGRRTSANHIVSWIPEPELGDAAPIGYLRYLDPGRELVWWCGGVGFLGANARLTVDMLLEPREGGSRLVARMSADATGATSRPMLWVFQIMDTIMARKQLLGIKQRVESYGARTSDPDNPETGKKDQYQFYEAIYASGESIGVKGKEAGACWRQAAIADGVLSSEV